MDQFWLKRLCLYLIALTFLGVLLFQGNISTQVARAQQGNCDPKLNPCTDTPTYPPKVTDTYPPKVTDTATYPPKVSDTPTNPPAPSDTSAPVQPSATKTSRPTVTITSTPKPTVLAPSSTPIPTVTAKPTELGVSGTPEPTQTSTMTATLKPNVAGVTVTPSITPSATLALYMALLQPTPTPQTLNVVLLPVGDIWVTGMEFTQAIQIYGTGGALDNSIPLIAGKKTVVRVYVQSDNYSRSWDRVTARLTVTGGREPGRVLLPITENSSATITVNPSGSQRGVYSDSFNFLLDQDETSSGSRHFSVSIFSISPRPELNTANNTFAMDAHFAPGPSIAFMGVVYGNDGTDPATPRLAAPPWSHFIRQWLQAENMAPVASYSIYYFPGLGTSPLMVPNLDAARAWADRILAQPGYLTSRIYLLQPESGRNGYAANRRMNGQDSSSAAVMAQEVGHSMGMWWHVSTVERPADMANTAYPYPDGTIGTQIGEDTSETGGYPQIYPVSPTWHDLTLYHDFMSYYPGSVWVSPYTYCTYLSTLTGGSLTCPAGSFHASLPAPAPARVVYRRPDSAMSTYLYVAGTLYPNNTASFEPFQQIQSATDITNVLPGDHYHLIFQDADGNSLQDIVFLARETHHEELTPVIKFNMTVPYPPGTSRISLLADGQTLAETAVSTHAPLIDFKFDASGQTIGGIQHLDWSATDADNDPLIYGIDYSRDAGQTWIPLNAGMQTASADINFDNLPGTEQGMLRVSASDGVNTSMALSGGTFKVASKAPIITSVSPDVSTYQGQPVDVEITAFDWEDGPITDPAAFTWVSDLDGKLTSGRWIAPGTLSAGNHTLTATVRDSDGNTASAQVHVTVLPADPQTAAGPVSLYQILFEYGLPVLLLVMIVIGVYLFKNRLVKKE